MNLPFAPKTQNLGKALNSFLMFSTQRRSKTMAQIRQAYFWLKAFDLKHFVASYFEANTQLVSELINHGAVACKLAAPQPPVTDNIG